MMKFPPNTITELEKFHLKNHVQKKTTQLSNKISKNQEVRQKMHDVKANTWSKLQQIVRQ